MREIKFRAWNKATETMFYDPYYFEQLRDGTCQFYEDWRDLEDGRSSPCEIMQFTGLKDKNGKNIYEGDIVRILYTDWISKSDDDHRTIEQYLIDLSNIGQVVFYNTSWEILRKDTIYPIEPGRHGFIEVIGNIYEHKHLLNE